MPAVIAAIVSWLVVAQLINVGWSRHHCDSPIRQAACRGLLPYFGSLALVSSLYALISLHIGLGMPDGDIRALLQLEQRIPKWARFASDLAPPWAALLVGALGLVLSQMAVSGPTAAGLGQQTVRASKWYFNLMQWAGAALGAASCFTLFGDGLKDRSHDIRTEIHEARLRIQATQDLAVRELARAVAQRAVPLAISAADDDAKAVARNLDLLRRRFADIDRTVVGSDRPRINHRQAFRAIMSISWPPATLPTAPSQPPEPLPDFRWIAPEPEKFPLRHAAARVRQVAGPVLREGKEDVAKEFMNVGLAAAKEAMSGDLVFSFLFDMVTGAVAEALKSIATRELLEPALNRVWAAAAKGELTLAIAGVSAELVTPVDPRSASRPLPETQREHYRLQAEQLRRAVASVNTEAHPYEPELLEGKDPLRLNQLLKQFKLSGVARVYGSAFMTAAKTPHAEDVRQDLRAVERLAVIALIGAASGKAERAEATFNDQVKRQVVSPRMRSALRLPGETYPGKPTTIRRPKPK